ncbi:Uncharacterised protein [Vibrio cholerae]|nr:Uncharacterised protein [Vibrio cholerae]
MISTDDSNMALLFFKLNLLKFSHMMLMRFQYINR